VGDDRIPCPRCNATGHAALPPDLQSTLDAARACAAAGEQITSHAVAKRAIRRVPVGITTFCNQLAELERFGFLWRHGRVGRRLVYDLPAD
jgi:hypothetical protein